MLSRTILAQSILSEDQFIADLTSLFRRRNISCGEPQDLERLATDLVADGAFRAALFNLCVVISHMGEVEFTPRELLILVARASGGSGIFNAEGNAVIPEATESAFLTGYDAWIHRDPNSNATEEPRHSDPFHAAMTRSAAEGFHYPAATPAPAPTRTIAPNAPLDSLTIAELRQYLDEIERRVSQIEPHMNQVARNDQAARPASPSAAHFEQLDALESEKLHAVIPFPHAPEPEPAPTAEILAYEPELIAIVEEPPAVAHEPELTPTAETLAHEPESIAAVEEIPVAEPELTHIAETLAYEPEPIATVEEIPAVTHEPELTHIAEILASEPAPIAVEETPAAEPEPTHATESLPPVEVLAIVEVVEAEVGEAKTEEAPALAEQPTSLTSEAPPETPQDAPEASALTAAEAAAEVAIIPTEPLPLTLQPEPTPGILIVEPVDHDQVAAAAHDAARLRRLRVANIILVILLVISFAFAGVVAFQYLHSSNRPIQLVGPVDRGPAPPTDSASPLAKLQSLVRTTPAPTPAKPAQNAATAAKPPQTTQATPAAAAQSDAAAPTTAPTPPAPVIRQSPEPAPANPAPTEAVTTPASPPPAEVKPAEPAARPTPQNDTPPPTQVAESKPAAPATAPAPLPAPRSTRPVDTTVNVPSSKMLTYAIAKPAPVPPPTRHNTAQTTVEVVAIISKEGKVTSAQAVSGTPDVRPAATQAMQAWRFKPYLVDGKPVEVITTFKFLFKGQ